MDRGAWRGSVHGVATCPHVHGDMTEQLTHTHTIVLCRILSAMQENRYVNCGMCRGRDRVQFSSV